MMVAECRDQRLAEGEYMKLKLRAGKGVRTGTVNKPEKKGLQRNELTSCMPKT